MKKAENEKKSLDDCFQLFIQNLKHLQHGLAKNFQNDDFFHNKLITACRDVPVCRFACYKPSDSVTGLINDIRSSILTFNKAQQTETFFTDRRFHGGNRPHNNNRNTSRPRYQYQPRSRGRYGRYDRARKACFVCKKEGCWSTNHTQEERDAQRDRVKNSFRKRYNDNEAERHTRAYIVGYEDTDLALGVEPDESDIEEEIEALMIDFDSPGTPESDETVGESSAFITDFGVMNGPEALADDLINRSFSHRFGVHFRTELVSRTTVPEAVLFITDIVPKAVLEVVSEIVPGIVPMIENVNRAWTFVSTKRYTKKKFFEVMIDTGASAYSTAGYGQFLAYSKIIETAINLAKAGAVNVQFDIGSISSIGSITIATPIGQAEFHVVEADTPFLLCLADLDRLDVYYNNTNDTLVQRESTISVIRRFGHPFLVWDSALYNCITESFNCNPCFLTEVELRRLHKRFEHPSVKKLANLLKRSGHDINRSTLKRLTKYCDLCQKHIKAPRRFRFTLREDVNFNHSIIADVMFIESSPMLHIVDEGTRYQAARWLKDMSAKHVWNMLRLC